MWWFLWASRNDSHAEVSFLAICPSKENQEFYLVEEISGWLVYWWLLGDLAEVPRKLELVGVPKGENWKLG